MASSATNIGNKYGSSLDSFTKDLKTGVDAVFLNWANGSIDIMRKIITTKARTKQASTLASTLYPFPIKDDPYKPPFEVYCNDKQQLND